MIDRLTAIEHLQRAGIPTDANFFTLSSSQVAALVERADMVKYRTPKNANGSRGRCFHEYLQRRINAKVAEHVIQSNHGYGWEDVHAEEDKNQARRSLREYRDNDRAASHRLVTRRVAAD